MYVFFLYGIGLLSSLATLLASWKTSTFLYWDFSYYIENTYRIYLGQLPYRDFVLVLTPGTYFIGNLIMKLFGTSYIFHVLYMMVISLLTVLVTHRILGFFSKNKITNVIVLFPLIFSGHVLYPLPSYDINAVFFSLVGIWMMLGLHANKKDNLLKYFLTGIAIVLPLLFKQNIGFVFLVLMFLLELFQLYVIDKKNIIKKIIAFSSGLLLIILSFFIYLQLTKSLGPFIFQTLVFPARVRLVKDVFNLALFDIFRVRSLFYYLPFICMGLFILFKKANDRILLFLTQYAVVISPLIYAFYLYLRYKNTVTDSSFIVGYVFIYITTIWFVVFICIALLLTWELLWKRTSQPKDSLSSLYTIVFLLFSLSPLMLHRIESASYAFYPLLAILLCIIIKKLEVVLPKYNWGNIIRVVSIGLSVYLFLFMFKGDLELYFQKNEDTLQSKRIKEIQEVKDMIRYTNVYIPRKDTIVSIPGQDAFYYLTKRTPPLPYFQYFSQTFPYTPRIYSDAIESKKINWVIIKSNLRFLDNPGVGDISYIETHLKDHYVLQKKIADYSIYKRIEY